MGRQRSKIARTTKNKAYKKTHDTKRRPRDVDQIQDDLKKADKLEIEYDEDLPGAGQYYCTECGRHFINQEHLDSHTLTRAHKRRYAHEHLIFILLK